MRKNLLGCSKSEIAHFFLKLGEKPVHARTFMHAVYHHGMIDFSLMALPAKLREKLHQHAILKMPAVCNFKIAADGVLKWVFALDDKNLVETVYIPQKTRGTLCISSQVGCALKCRFCATGERGFTRHLTAAEIIAQVVFVKNFLDGQTIRNVVFMGMGEPLLNEDSVYRACDLLTAAEGFGLSKRRVTISTAGIVPAIERMSEKISVSLAVSLHAPNDKLRDYLVPVNRKYPLTALLGACRHYLGAGKNRHIFFEYVMLCGLNDTPSHAMQLGRLLSEIPAKVNLIPLNPSTNLSHRPSSVRTMCNFQNILLRNGVRTTIRKTRGANIQAACGQLGGTQNPPHQPVKIACSTA